MSDHRQRLKRLDPEFYRGLAWVHWVMAIEGRRSGWLDAKFLYKFREVLTHVAFRYQLACPIFCLMPDHMHMLWCGLSDADGGSSKVLATLPTDQRVAMKTLRKDLNACLKRIGFRLQLQAYDHVLRDQDLERSAIERTAEYIARNPERKGLVAIDCFADYSFSGCLLPGYPQIRLFSEDGWDVIWRTLSFLKRTRCFRVLDPKHHPA